MRKTPARGSAKQRRPASVTLESYREDPMYPRIAGAVDAILKGGKVVAPVEVLARMDLLEPGRLEDWPS